MRNRIEFRCSEKEKSIIAEKAKEAGLDVSKFCRQLCVEGIKVKNNRADTRSLEEEIDKLSWEVKKVGINVNQMAHILNANENFSMHSFKEFENNFKSIEEKINKIQEQIEDVYSKWQ